MRRILFAALAVTGLFTLMASGASAAPAARLHGVQAAAGHPSAMNVDYEWHHHRWHHRHWNHGRWHYWD